MPDRDAATTLEREIAARLQEQADEVRDGTSDRMHRIVRATGDGWVEIQGEYLGHLIDRLDALLADNERLKADKISLMRRVAKARRDVSP